MSFTSAKSFLQIGMLWLAFSISHPSVTIWAAEPIPFAKTIAPILQQHCIHCHSPSNTKGDISLATIVDLVKNEHVVAGDPEGSDLLELLTASDGKPPTMPKEGDPLSAAEVALLRRWIAEGANWPKEVIVREKSKADASWWSLQPVRNVQPPAPEGLPEAWQGNPIDRFVYARLAAKGLKPGSQADARTLIRRLSFDLLGMPPSPEEVMAFESDADPKAYDKLVDRLLESPHYGERFARHWLDIAHYADTHGFERDKRRDHAWRYRDYVIQAFNEDKPYHRFLQEQIAGDVLWPADGQAVIATGFLAAGPWDFVGQVETQSLELRRAARSLDLDDMATQVMTATMAMTVNCARCHDHKLDPITQEEYYRLRAVFAGVKREDRFVSQTAVDELVAARVRLAAEIDRLEPGLNLADIVGGGDGKGTGKAKQGIDPRSGKVESKPMGFLENIEPNRFAPVDSRFIDGVFIPKGEQEKAKIPISSTGLAITGIPAGDGKAWDMIRNGPVNSQHSPELGGIDFTAEGNSLLGLHANAGITFDLVQFREALGEKILRFTAQVGYFGKGDDQSFADAWVFVDGTKVAEFRQLKRADNLQDIDVLLPESARFLTLMSTDGGNGIGMDQIGFGNPILKSDAAGLPVAERERLAKLREEKNALDAKIAAYGTPKVYAVVAEQAIPDVQVLRRGDAESPSGDPLDPGAFAALAMLDPDLGDHGSSAGERRAALAGWITDANNPLTRRVIVNRLWHWHFGQGIVNTPSDFGFGGGQPSHPELLDWLAEELLRQNWSLKSMQRLILTSAAYKQDSRHAAAATGVAVDADNRLLWRQNPHRIEAEAVRDAVLFVSGKLNLERGGPGFEDFKYEEAYAPIYNYITADEPALWRRSIYRYVVRTTPQQFLMTLDCPDPANLTPRRNVTTTALQSLALFNNDFMLRQAEYFAERLGREADTADAQIQRAFQLAFSRPPREDELAAARQLVDEKGWMHLCRVLLNANEFVYVD